MRVVKYLSFDFISDLFSISLVTSLSEFMMVSKIILLLTKSANYDLAITRSGASTISELAYLNIPFVAIPFPYAKDNHQYYNAEFYEKNKCCWLITQKDINENNFIDLMNKIFENKNEYISKKKNLIELSKENTWEKNKFKMIELINEN